MITSIDVSIRRAALLWWVASVAALASLASAQVDERAPTLGAIYPSDRTQSPITEPIAERLRRLAEVGDLRASMFAKIGASATVNRNYLRCFDGPHVRLGEREDLRAALRYFRDGHQENPFVRESRAAGVGWHAGRAVWGNPSLAVREVRAIDPRFAVMMFGTNDIELGRPRQYAQLMWRLTEVLTVRGVIPVMSTIMPRDDDLESDRRVGLYNAVVRGIAQARELPLVDYHRELSRLPGHGLSRDGVHPNVYFRNGDAMGCDFGPEGLRHGYNVRNLITLTALDRLRRIVIHGEDAPDEAAPGPEGAGSMADPIVISSLPFSHASDTARSPHGDRSFYACAPTHDESGPEVVYRLELEEPARIHALVLEEDGVDVDIHVLSDVGGRMACVARGNDHLEVMLRAGTHLLSIDTHVDSRGRARSGRYLLVVARVDRPS